MIFRAAQARDAAAVLAIMNDVITQTTHTFTTVPKTLDQVQADIAMTSPFFVAVKDHVVVGYARTFPFRGGPGYAHVAEYSIALTADAKGLGAGRRLLQTLCDAVQDIDIKQIIGAVSSSNTDALAFHTAVGFSQVGLIPEAGQKWGQTLDLILMQKRL